MTARDPAESKMTSDPNGHTSVVATTPTRKTDSNGTVVSDLRGLERLFADCPWPVQAEFVRARRRARKRALDILACSSAEQKEHTALIVAATELIGALRVALAALPLEAARLVSRLEEIARLPRIELAREVL